MTDEPEVIVISQEDYDFITRVDPDRERQLNRAQLVELLHEIQDIIIEGRV